MCLCHMTQDFKFTLEIVLVPLSDRQESYVHIVGRAGHLTALI